jgi:hypothetical protein
MMNIKRYNEAHATLLSAQIDRVNALSDLADAQQAGADTAELNRAADEADKAHTEALKTYEYEAIKAIVDILMTLSDVITQK